MVITVGLFSILIFEYQNQIFESYLNKSKNNICVILFYMIYKGAGR